MSLTRLSRSIIRMITTASTTAPCRARSARARACRRLRSGPSCEDDRRPGALDEAHDDRDQRPIDVELDERLAQMPRDLVEGLVRDVQRLVRRDERAALVGVRATAEDVGQEH